MRLITRGRSRTLGAAAVLAAAVVAAAGPGVGGPAVAASASAAPSPFVPAYVGVGVSGPTSAHMGVIDTKTKEQVGGKIRVGGEAYGVEFTPDGKDAWVSGIAYEPETDTFFGFVSTIRTATETKSGSNIDLSKRCRGSDSALTPDGKRLYVACGNERSEDVVVISTAKRKKVAEVETTNVEDGSFGVAVTPDGKRAYLTNEAGDVSVIDTATNKKAGPDIAVGQRPHGIAIAPDGKTAYVANRSDNDVSVIDTATNTTVGPDIPVGNDPRRIALTPDGTRAYVVNAGDEESRQGTVSVIDTAANTKLSPEIRIGESPGPIAISPVPASTAARSAASRSPAE